MREKKVTVGDLKVGDTIRWYGNPTKIASIVRWDGLVTFILDVPPGVTNHHKCTPSSAVYRFEPERVNHGVCRDSDCDCIFDEVP